MSPLREQFVYNATLVYSSACVADKGLIYSPKPEVYNTDSDPMMRRYGVSSLESARRFGYHLPAAAATADPLAGVSDEVRTALTTGAGNAKLGTKSGGCEAAAASATHTDRAQQSRENGTGLGYVSRIDSESYQETLQDSRLAGVFSQWSACMKSAGYDFATPIAASNSADLTTGTPSDSEIKQAVADVRCKKATSLVAKWSTLESPIQRTLIDKYATQVSSLQTLQKAQLASAQHILHSVSIPS